MFFSFLMYSTDTGSPYVEVKQKKMRKYIVSEVPGFILFGFNCSMNCCFVAMGILVGSVWY